MYATDVRMASKEQVESLGGKFLTVEGSENLETEGGYAKEASDDFKKKQEELLGETLKKIDIVICTALIPGKKAPVIIKDKMIKESNQDPYLVGPLAVKPKRNSCILMRVGSAHYVNPVRDGKPGCRVVITGWPFANMDWKAKFNQ